MFRNTIRKIAHDALVRELERELGAWQTGLKLLNDMPNPPYETRVEIQKQTAKCMVIEDEIWRETRNK